MFGLGMPELVVILIVVMFLFGGKRLPELASGMGKAIRNFKKASIEQDEGNAPDRQRVTEGSSCEKEGSGANA